MASIHGTFNLETESGVGTTVRLVIPLSKQSNAVPSYIHRIVTPGEWTNMPRKMAITICIVEDDAGIRESIVDIWRA